MATVYSKLTNTYTDSIDLLTKLSASLVTAGYTQSSFVDNIISGNNLGKKLIMTKSSKYYYFAASDNNCPWGFNSTAVSRSMSSIAGCVSNTLNAANNWFLNGPDSKYINAEIKPGGTYFLYYNDVSFILVIRHAANTYSVLSMGLGVSDDNDVKLYQGGSCSTTIGSLSRYETFPFIYSGTTAGRLVLFSNSTLEDVESNHFGQGSSYSYGGSNNGYGAYPKSFNVHNGVAALLPIMFRNSDTLAPSFSIPNLFVISFEKMTPEAIMDLETRSYDVYPFFQKQSPVNYDSNETYGCGFAIKTAGT